MADPKGMVQKDLKSVPQDVYSRVPVRRPRKVEFSGPPALGIAVLGIEVCQTVQSLDNSVPLIAHKPTLVRVYLDHSSLLQPVTLRGELTLRSTENGPATYLPSLNEIRADPAAAPTTDDQRDDLKFSLNFVLPADMTATGDLFIALNRLVQNGGDDQPFAGQTSTRVTFGAVPPIRVRCIGLRYRDTASGQNFTPGATHFAYFQSFLKRAYPVPNVIWSHMVVDANFTAPFNSLTSTLANAQLAAIRNADINAGMDPRTHYYGLVDDANGVHFMRGRASGIPAGPQPDTVASGPCGIPNGFAGDNDLSYADWYGAHELGHTFGRFHPGFPPGSQDSSDANFPYDNGQISNADRRYVGYDMGDTTLDLPMRALQGDVHHDIMTYAPRQWVSAYTYAAIRQRLIEEDQAFAPALV